MKKKRRIGRTRRFLFLGSGWTELGINSKSGPQYALGTYACGLLLLEGDRKVGGSPLGSRGRLGRSSLHRLWRCRPRSCPSGPAGPPPWLEEAASWSCARPQLPLSGVGSQSHTFCTSAPPRRRWGKRNGRHGCCPRPPTHPRSWPHRPARPALAWAPGSQEAGRSTWECCQATAQNSNPRPGPGHTISLGRPTSGFLAGSSVPPLGHKPREHQGVRPAPRSLLQTPSPSHSSCPLLVPPMCQACTRPRDSMGRAALGSPHQGAVMAKLWK